MRKKVVALSPKGTETRAKIIRAALYCLAHHGDRGTSFQKIADQCGVSQPLVVHYFKKRENIFTFVFKDFLFRAREITEKALAEDLPAPEKLKSYFRVSLSLVRVQPEWLNLYLMLHYQACYHEKARLMNSKMKEIAVKRVTSIIEQGIKDGDFRKVDAPLVAKLLHISLVGLILGISTENPSHPDSVLLRELESLALKYLEK